MSADGDNNRRGEDFTVSSRDMATPRRAANRRRTAASIVRANVDTLAYSTGAMPAAARRQVVMAVAELSDFAIAETSGEEIAEAEDGIHVLILLNWTNERALNSAMVPLNLTVGGKSHPVKGSEIVTACAKVGGTPRSFVRARPDFTSEVLAMPEVVEELRRVHGNTVNIGLLFADTFPQNYAFKYDADRIRVESDRRIRADTSTPNDEPIGSL